MEMIENQDIINVSEASQNAISLADTLTTSTIQTAATGSLTEGNQNYQIPNSTYIGIMAQQQVQAQLSELHNKMATDFQRIRFQVGSKIGSSPIGPERRW